ncbi:MAG: caspase family protein [Alphaproteobacteria bacterium]|nr:caspase family protein [Alphaproteobacteria bacterium]
MRGGAPIPRSASAGIPALLAVLVCLGFWPVSAQPRATTEFGRYHALVIGVNDYQRMPKLKSAVNDASAVADTLRRDFGFATELLLNPRRADILLALDRYRRELTPDDNLLVYFAGHGVLDHDSDQGFWLPVEADREVQVDWIPLQSVIGTMRAMLAKHVMVVSDSCFSGMLARSAGPGLPQGGDRALHLKRLSEKRVRTAMTSGGLEPVLDAGGQGHSVFTRAFLEALRVADDVTEGQSLFAEVRRRVILASNQTPEYADVRLAGHEGGDFLFVPLHRRLPAAAPAMVPAPPQAASTDRDFAYELAFWESIRNSSNPADYRAYLEAFPQGRFAPLARVRAGQAVSAVPSPGPAAPPARPPETGRTALAPPPPPPPPPPPVSRADPTLPLSLEFRPKAQADNHRNCTNAEAALGALRWQVSADAGEVRVSGSSGTRTLKREPEGIHQWEAVFGNYRVRHRLDLGARPALLAIEIDQLISTNISYVSAPCRYEASAGS